MKEILHRELTDAIIRIAIDVRRELGVGFLEKVYEIQTSFTTESHGIKSC
jgi:hypothetical protein